MILHSFLYILLIKISVILAPIIEKRKEIKPPRDRKRRQALTQADIQTGFNLYDSMEFCRDGIEVRLNIILWQFIFSAPLIEKRKEVKPVRDRKRRHTLTQEDIQTGFKLHDSMEFCRDGIEVSFNMIITL